MTTYLADKIGIKATGKVRQQISLCHRLLNIELAIKPHALDELNELVTRQHVL